MSGTVNSKFRLREDPRYKVIPRPSQLILGQRVRLAPSLSFQLQVWALTSIVKQCDISVDLMIANGYYYSSKL